MSAENKTLALAHALGYTPTLDMPAGYGVERVILDRPCAGSLVFDPVQNDAQAMEVLCWLLANGGRKSIDVSAYVDAFRIFAWDGRGVRNYQHDNTPASLRAAIVQAAGRVCGS